MQVFKIWHLCLTIQTYEFLFIFCIIIIIIVIITILWLKKFVMCFVFKM